MIEWQLYNNWNSVKDIWPVLLRQSATSTFFQELTIQQSWWESAGKPELFLVMVSESGVPIALFPFVKQNDILQFLGDQDVSDYLDVLVKPGSEPAAFEGLGQCLTNHPEIKKLELLSLPEQSSTFAALNALATKQHWNYQQTQQDVCPIIELPSTWDEYLVQLGKKQRHEVKRKWQRLEEQGNVTFRTVTDTNADPVALQTFFTLHQQSSVEKAAFWTPQHRRYFELLSKAASEGGWLRLFFLDFDGKPVSAMYCFDYNNEMLVYNSGFNASDFGDRSAGHVLTAFTIKESIQQGKKRYDFLRGGEEFKMRYHPEVHLVFNVLVEITSVS